MALFRYIFHVFSSVIPENNRFERIWKLAQVDFKKRYYNDRLGLIWALLNPIFHVLIYYIVFTLAFSRSIGGIDNYALFLFSGLIFWMAFTETCRKGMRVLYQKRYLIQNIRVNKVDLYLSNTFSVFLGFFFNLLVFIFLCGLFGFIPTSKYLFLPILIINLFILSMGVSMILSFIHIYFKDINHLIDIVFLLGFWGSGIMFDSEVLFEKVRIFYYMNPFIGIIKNCRSIILYQDQIDISLMSINIMTGIIMLIAGNFLIVNKSYRVYENM